MSKIEYVSKNFQEKSMDLILVANDIIDQYTAEGFSLTLRQLYYQMVSRDLIPNSDRSYSRLGSILNDARLAGLVSWDAIEDRTREVLRRTDWQSPDRIIQAVQSNYTLNLWEGQQYAPEVWVEKEALLDVINRACQPLGVPRFACRGYSSATAMWDAGQRFVESLECGQIPIIIHLGDHDPSGIDMTRDITDRIALFVGEKVQVERIALNMNQVRRYGPPPNPAKMTDSRSDGYVREFGRSSWELDALEPSVLVELIQRTIRELITDDDNWEGTIVRENEGKKLLGQVSARWDEVEAMLSSKK